MMVIVNAAEAQGLYELAEAGRIAARTHQPDAEKPVGARYPDAVAALQWHLDRGEIDAGSRLAPAQAFRLFMRRDFTDLTYDGSGRRVLVGAVLPLAALFSVTVG